MNDQFVRDIICILLFMTVVTLTFMGHVIPDQVKDWADIAFGCFFGPKASGYVMTAAGMLKTKNPAAVAAPAAVEEVKP